MADDLLSRTGTKVRDSDFSKELFFDAENLWFNNQNVDELLSDLPPPDNELLTEQELGALWSDQQNLEGTSSSILNNDRRCIYGTSSGNYGGSSGMHSSSECWTVCSEAQSQSPVQCFQPGIASYGQRIAQDESNQKSALPHVEEGDGNPSVCGNNGLQYESTIYLKDQTSEMNFQVPKLGMVFSSEEEGYKFYSNYATKKGFCVRKGKTQRLPNGTIRKRVLYCSREGFRLEDKLGKARKYRRKETRTGCKAMIQFTHNSGKWMITRIVLEHNHDTNVRNHGHITLPSTSVSEENIEIDTTKQAMMVEEIGFENSPESFPFVNLSNYYLSNENTNILPPEDSQSLVNFLDHLQLDDPSFFYTVQLDPQSRIKNFFWRDSRSKIDYEYFGDTLILDTTFRIEKYGIICAFLVGVNHHKQYILFGCAFLLDDSTESFNWLFKTFVKAMAQCQPRVIFTNEHQSISNAVELELHETQHFLAMWYISQNARRHLSEAFKLPHFEDEFNKCISGCTSEKEFYFKWQALFETYKLEENSWLNALYNMRKKWSHVFNSAEIRFLQECENITNVFHNLTSETITPSEFAWQYMRAAENLRKKELYEDFCCNGRKQPMILENSELEKQAADTYTVTIFKLFQKELHRCQSLAVEEIANNGELFKFKIMDEGHRCNFVEFNCLKLEVTCSCRKYELTGILCSHALKVFDVRNINRLPSHYIRKRWTKFAKDGMVTDDHKQEIVDQSKGQSSSFTCRVMHKALNVITKSVAVKKNQKIVENHLDMALKEVENVLKAKITGHLDGRDAEIHGRNGSLNGIACMQAQRKVPNRSCNSQMTLAKGKSFVDADHWPLKKASRGGYDQPSLTRFGRRNHVGENSLLVPRKCRQNSSALLSWENCE